MTISHPSSGTSLGGRSITIQAETEVLDGLYLELKNAKTESDAQLIEQKI